MKLLPLVLLSGLLAFAQPAPVLTQTEIEQLEIKVAQNPRDIYSQGLLGKNYALFILGITGLDRYSLATDLDPSRSQSEFAQHAWNVLNGPAAPDLLGEGGEALWNYSLAAMSYEILHHQPERRELYT